MCFPDTFQSKYRENRWPELFKRGPCNSNAIIPQAVAFKMEKSFVTDFILTF